MGSNYDVVIVGVGGWGSAALYHCAKAGLSVCGLEQFSIPHDFGSSHGETRIIRMAYFLHPDYVPLLRRSYKLWRELESETGQELLRVTGLLCAGEADGAFIGGLEKCYSVNDLAHEKWTSREASQHFRQFHLPEEAVCYWDPFGGFLKAQTCIETFTALGKKHGAMIKENSEVRSIRPSANSVTVETQTETISAAQVIVTSGAYPNIFSGREFPAVLARRKVMFWYPVDVPSDFAPDQFPVWIAKLGGYNYYGFPSLDGQTVKAAEDSGGQDLLHPKFSNPALQAEDEQRLRPFLGTLFGHRLGPAVRFQRCLYELSADRHFMIDHDPNVPGIIYALGGSGHGFKFSAVIGEMLAQLATGGRCSRPDFLRWRNLGSRG